MCLLHGCQDLAVNAGLDPIDRALHAQAPAIQNVRVDHRSTDVRVGEQLLDGTGVVSGFEPASSKCVAKECRKVWQLTRFVKPARRADSATARGIADSCR